MVLQRDTPLKIWGWAAPGEAVGIRFRHITVETRATAKGRWQLTLKPQSPGGPFTMTIVGSNRIVLNDILVGDVWLASGQSNMEFTLQQTDHARDDIATSANDQIRLFKVAHQLSLFEAEDLESDGWKAAAPEATKDFSAVAFLFGQRLQARYRVPIGLIQSTWGGTAAQSWTSAASLLKIPDFARDAAEISSFRKKDAAGYRRYDAQVKAFLAAHRKDDDGTVEGKPVWAARGLDISHWETILLPRPDEAWGADYRRFDGIIWFRRDIDVPTTVAHEPVTLHLGAIWGTVRVFWNGVEVTGSAKTTGSVFTVPAELVQAERAEITLRLTGGDGYAAIMAAADPSAARSSRWSVPLNGEWRYRVGTDISSMPPVHPLFRFMAPGISVLWNGMIAPAHLFGFPCVLWYQGEANVGHADQYRSLFPAMISGWRQTWKRPLPFLFVQIAGHDGYAPLTAPPLREAQAFALRLPATAMATAADLGLAEDIHPTNKRDIAARLEVAARALVYREAVEYSGPTLQGAVTEGSKLRLRFDHNGGGLVNRSPCPLRGFEVAGADGVFSAAEAVIDRTTVVVESPTIAHPVAVRYRWANTPDGTLGNRAGLPAGPFRYPIPEL